MGVPETQRQLTGLEARAARPVGRSKPQLILWGSDLPPGIKPYFSNSLIEGKLNLHESSSSHGYLGHDGWPTKISVLILPRFLDVLLSVKWYGPALLGAVCPEFFNGCYVYDLAGSWDVSM